MEKVGDRADCQCQLAMRVSTPSFASGAIGTSWHR
jgi:hypothetical protein